VASRHRGLRPAGLPNIAPPESTWCDSTYDTILFVGLDDKIWWSHSAGNPEGIATFFVALSRAKQRAIFTFCRERGQRTRVADLYALLTLAGVPEVAC
jgi:hypothetical protein